jgi:hypothetical protein
VGRDSANRFIGLARAAETRSVSVTVEEEA